MTKPGLHDSCTVAGFHAGSKLLARDQHTNQQKPAMYVIKSLTYTNSDVNDFLLERLSPKFVDVVGLEDLRSLFETGR